MQIIRYGKYKDQIDIIPYISIYLHHHFDYKGIWHFHISIQWIIYYFEIQIGKDYKEE
jgi:hypothetical protein